MNDRLVTGRKKTTWMNRRWGEEVERVKNLRNLACETDRQTDR